MTVRARNNYYLMITVIICSIIAVIGLIIGAIIPENIAKVVNRPISYVHNMAIIVAVSIILYKFFRFALLNKMFKHGLMYALKHSNIQKTIENELARCDIFYSKDKSGIYNPIYVLLNLNKNFQGKIYISVLPKFFSKLENLEFSSVLPGFLVVENKYFNDEGSFLVLIISNFELKPLRINSVESLIKIAQEDEYMIKMDEHITYNLSHTLIAGITGSGKSFYISYLITSLFCKKAELYIADPKNSDIAVLAGELLPADHHAVETSEIVMLIEKVGEILKERQVVFQNLLQSSEEITKDYRAFGLRPIVFILDEAAAFLSVLPKKEKESVISILSQIVLKGRQIGVIAILAMQQVSSTVIPTSISENCPNILILGESGRQTVMNLLGALPDCYSRKYEAGQGMFVAPEISTVDNPKVVATPYLSPDILSKKGIRELKESVTRDSGSESVT